MQNEKHLLPYGQKPLPRGTVTLLSSQGVGGTYGKPGTLLMESCVVGDQQQVKEGMEAGPGTSR